MERERDKHVHEYRAKKIKLYEKMVAQQDEMLQLQRRSTEAVELIVAKFPGHSLNSPLSPFSVSPIISSQIYHKLTIYDRFGKILLKDEI